MSLIQEVAEAVRELGRATADDIHIEGKTRRQIMKALANAVRSNLIRVVKPTTLAKGNVRELSVYEAVKQELGPRGNFGIPKVASVWDLGKQPRGLTER